MRVLLVALAGCLGNEPLASQQDPYCPPGWSTDVTQKSGCNPPIGYDTIVWAELGGSGAYGFVRAGQAYLDCVAANKYEGYDAPCPCRFVGDVDVPIYLEDTTASLIGTAHTNAAGVFKVRLEPGKYRLAGTDPSDGAPFTSGLLTVVPQGVAMVDVEVATVATP